MTAASILDIDPKDAPVHQISVVGVTTVTNSAVITEFGVQIECIVSDYISKEKQADLPITLFHPSQSRLTTQTTIIKRGSTIFFSGALTSIEGKLYLELQNFNFVHCQQTSSPNSAKMLWSKSLTQTPETSSQPSQTIAQKIHGQKSKNPIQINKSTTSKNPIQVNKPRKLVESSTHTSSINQTSGIDDQTWDIDQPFILDTSNFTHTDIPQISEYIEQNSHISQSSNIIQSLATTRPSLQTPQTPRTSRKKLSSNSTLPPTPTSTTSKRKTRSSYRNSNKLQKLADIASNALAAADSDLEIIEVEAAE